MWNPEISEGAMALVTVPTSLFGDGSREVPLGNYWPLPRPTGSRWSVHNRFVNDHLLYSGGSVGTAGDVTVVSLHDRSTVRLPLSHGVERIDAIGSDAIVVGSGTRALGFSTIGLTGGVVRHGEVFMLPNAQENETRSHAFFFRADPGSVDASSGVLGLPVSRMQQDRDRVYRQSAGMLFLSRRSGRLAEAGQLNAAASAVYDGDDGCKASCVDWYGNARPIFVGSRLFALLGYELVEGAEQQNKVRERQRITFAPPPSRGRR